MGPVQGDSATSAGNSGRECHAGHCSGIAIPHIKNPELVRVGILVELEYEILVARCAHLAFAVRAFNIRT